MRWMALLLVITATPVAGGDIDATFRWLSPASFAEPTPNDPTLRAQRDLRGAKFNRPGAPGIQEPPPAIAEIPTITHWNAHLPEIPAAQSAAVVLAKVVAGATHLSPDKSTAYSEFGIRVERVFKAPGGRDIRPADTLAAQRAGGIVVFPSGRRLAFSRVMDAEAPERNRRYVLFLEWDQVSDTFPIITGYALIGGRVRPLDVGRFSQMRGRTVAAFLTAVEQAVGGGSE